MKNTNILQEWLILLNEENYNDICIKIKNSIYLENEDNVKNLITAILRILATLPHLIPLVADIIIKVILNNSSFAFLEYFKQNLLKFSLTFKIHPFPMEIQIPCLSFLRCLIDKSGFYTKEDIQTFMKKIFNIAQKDIYQVLYYIYFLPELDDTEVEKMHQHNMQDYLSKYKSKSVTDSFFLSEFVSFLSHLDEYKSNDYSLLKTSIRNNCIPSSFLLYLKNDDLNEFQLFTASSTDFDFNEILQPNIFEPNVILQNYPPLISYTAYYGSIKCFKFLLLNNVKLDIVDNNQLYPEHFAIAGGNVEIVHLIEQRRFSISLCAHVACQYYKYDIFQWLTNTKVCDLTEKMVPYGTLLHICAFGNNTPILSSLLKSSFNVNELNSLMLNPLHIACEMHSHEAAICLIKTDSIDVNILAPKGRTCLHLSCYSDSPQIISALREFSNIDVNKPDGTGKTALHIAAENGFKSCIIELLKFKSIDPHIKTDLGETAMMLAVTKSNIEAIKVFQEHDLLDPNDSTNAGTTLLHVACSNGLKDLVSYFLSLPQTNINITDALNQTPLLHAISYGQTEIVSILLGHPEIDFYHSDTFHQNAKTIFRVVKNPEIDSMIEDYINEHNQEL